MIVELSLFAVAITLIGLAYVVMRAHPQSHAKLWFGAFALFGAVWATAIAEWHRGIYPDLWSRVAFAGSSLIPAAFLGFSIRFTTDSRPSIPTRSAPLLLYSSLVCGGVLAILSLATDLVVYDATATPAGIARRSGALYQAFAIYFLASLATAFGILVLKWRRARGLTRAQLHYVIAATAISFSGGVITNLLIPWFTGRSDYSWIGPYFGCVLVVLIAHAIIRHRLLDLRLVVHRGLTVTLAAALSLLPGVVVLAVFWPRLLSHLQPTEVLGVILAMLSIGLAIPVTRAAATRLLDRYVYRAHANYQRTVREASDALTRVLDLNGLLTVVSRTIATSTGTEGIAVYLQEGDVFLVRKANVTQDPHGSFTSPDTAPQSIVDALSVGRGALVSDEVGRLAPDKGTGNLFADLTALGWALVLPVVSEETVIGAVVLGAKRSGDPFYPEDLDLLTTLTNQAGIAIKNAQLYAEIVLANEYLTNIVTTIKSGVVAIGAAGLVTMFNRSAEQLTGLRAREVHARPATTLPSSLADALHITLADGQARTLPEIELPGGSTSRPVICTTSPLRDATGRVVGAVAVFSDLTPLKELEVERRRAERLAYFEMLASGLAHEIKNPLVAIKTFAQLIPRRHEDPQFVQEFSRIVTREIDQMERLVERLGALARPTDRPLLRLDVRVPIRESIEFVQPALDEKRIRVTIRLGDQPAWVLGDHGQLKQLFLNLIMNAHEATPPDGEVVIEIACGEECVTATMADSGPGIAPELLERIFDPFFTTRQKGSGLGLAICAGIAAMHRARLRAANAPGGGARFTIDFPVAASLAVPVPT